MVKSLRVTSVAHTDNEADARDTYTALGYSIRDYGAGFIAYPRHRGKWWLYILFALPTYGLGALVYFLYCRIHRANGVYIKVQRGTVEETMPAWALEAYKRYREGGLMWDAESNSLRGKV